MFICIKIEEQFVRLIHHFGDARVGAVGLVDDEDYGKLRLERFAKHKSGLGKWTFRGIDQENDPVDHLQPALDLATEVRVAWCVDHVDDDRALSTRPGIVDRGVLRQDCDALFFLKVIGIHHPVDEFAMRGECASLAKHLIDESGLAVVDVGDDGNVSDVIASGEILFSHSKSVPDLSNRSFGGFDP